MKEIVMGFYEFDRIRAKNANYNCKSINYAIYKTFSQEELDKLHKQDICSCFVAEDRPHFKYCNKSGR